MSFHESVSAAIAPADRQRVKTVAAAILDHMGLRADNLVDMIIDDKAKDLSWRHLTPTGTAVDLAACIVNYLREDLEPELEQGRVNIELLQALQREAGQ